MVENLKERTCTIASIVRAISTKFRGLHNDSDRSSSRREAIKCKYCEIQCPREFVELTAPPRGVPRAHPVKCRCVTATVSDTLRFRRVGVTSREASNIYADEITKLQRKRTAVAVYIRVGKSERDPASKRRRQDGK